jgi:hypothetical protein
MDMGKSTSKEPAGVVRHIVARRAEGWIVLVISPFSNIYF